MARELKAADTEPRLLLHFFGPHPADSRLALHLFVSACAWCKYKLQLLLKARPPDAPGADGLTNPPKPRDNLLVACSVTDKPGDKTRCLGWDPQLYFHW